MFLEPLLRILESTSTSISVYAKLEANVGQHKTTMLEAKEPLLLMFAISNLLLLQVVMLVFFCIVAVDKLFYGYGLLFLCFGVGLIGGLGYVNAFRLVAEAVPPELKELALASASVGDSFGVMLSDIFGVFVQACVYKKNGIPGALQIC